MWPAEVRFGKAWRFLFVFTQPMKGEDTMKKSYDFRTGFRNPGKLDPQETGEFLEQICTDNSRELWPERTIDAAKPKDSPIHDHFEWSDKTAAKEYRLHQARNLHNSVFVTVKSVEGKDVRERAFIHVRDRKKAPYRGVEDILTDPKWKEMTRHVAVKDMLRAKTRLERWQEFAHVCKMLEEAMEALDAVPSA